MASKVAAGAIVAVTTLLLFAAYRNSTLSHPGPPDMSSLPPVGPRPAWNGAYAAFVIKEGAERGEVRRDMPTLRHPALVNQFEVDLHLGLFILRQTDLFVDDSIPLVLTRTYRPWDAGVHAFGAGANHPYDISPAGTRNPYTYLDLMLEDGRGIHYPRISRGTSFTNAVYRHEETASEFFDSEIAWNGNGWTLKFADGSEVTFPEAYHARRSAQGAATGMKNAAGRRVGFERDGDRNLKTLTSPAGHWVRFRYDDRARIVEARSDAGAVRQYGYDATGHLASVGDGARVLFEFEYEPLIKAAGFDPYVMTAVRDGAGRELLRNVYGDGGHVSEQRLAGGKVYRYQYVLDAGNYVKLATIIMPDGTRQQVSF